MDCDNKILAADQVVPHLLAFMNFTSTPAWPWSTPVRSIIEGQFCLVHDTFCTGANQQFATNAECLDYMSGLPLGNPDSRGIEDSLFCRSTHVEFIPLRPDVHCAHIGRNSSVCTHVPHWLLYQHISDPSLRLFTDNYNLACHQDWLQCEENIQPLVDWYEETFM